MKKLTQEEFIKQCNKVHNNKYDYSLTRYKNTRSEVDIICPDHGEFKKLPIKHLQQGCPKCKIISKGEKKILKILDKHSIRYIKEKTFDGCKNVNKLRFDFFLPDYNLCIEYDGIHHFKSIDFFGGEENLSRVKKMDEIKNEYCDNNNIELLRIKYKDYKKIPFLLKNKLLSNEII